MRAMSLVEALSQRFPISSEHHSLELVDADSGEGSLVATVRLIVWDVQGEERMVRDIKEQQVTIVAAENLEDPRVPAYLEGLAAALGLAFARVDEAIADKGHGAVTERIQEAMPSEFFPADVLTLRRPQTAEDFSDALLTNRKRLGWLLP